MLQNRKEGAYMDKTIDILYILQVLGLTLVFSGLIGFERERKHKIAGLTTHILVALGAAGITLVQELMVQDSIQFILENPELAGSVVIERQRIVAQIVTGVGFLGAGAILKTNGYITGLTTASSLWMSAIIGIIFAAGYSVLGIIISILVIVVLTIVKSVFGKTR
jgi:putative Mg2+ transporter-C (MgtC) family protein